MSAIPTKTVTETKTVPTRFRVPGDRRCERPYIRVRGPTPSSSSFQKRSKDTRRICVALQESDDSVRYGLAIYFVPAGTEDIWYDKKMKKMLKHEALKRLNENPTTIQFDDVTRTFRLRALWDLCQEHHHASRLRALVTTSAAKQHEARDRWFTTFGQITLGHMDDDDDDDFSSFSAFKLFRGLARERTRCHGCSGPAGCRHGGDHEDPVNKLGDMLAANGVDASTVSKAKALLGKTLHALSRPKSGFYTDDRALRPDVLDVVFSDEDRELIRSILAKFPMVLLAATGIHKLLGSVIKPVTEDEDDAFFIHATFPSGETMVSTVGGVGPRLDTPVIPSSDDTVE